MDFNFKERSLSWHTPSGFTWDICDDMLKQTHLVIGGTTGSGKSTLLHSLIYSALIHSPARIQFVLIDLKGTELRRYCKLPHTISYADEPEDAIRAIEMTKALMRKRLDEMKRNDLTTYPGNDIYLIIDEMAVLMQTAKAKVLAPLADIMRLGRAARVHVISATQNPSRSHGGGLPSEIVSNATSSVCLRVRSSIESRQTIGQAGGELLPQYGQGLYWNPTGTSRIAIPMTSDEELQNRITYWVNAKPIQGGN